MQVARHRIDQNGRKLTERIQVPRVTHLQVPRHRIRPNGQNMTKSKQVQRVTKLHVMYVILRTFLCLITTQFFLISDPELSTRNRILADQKVASQLK